MTDVSQVANDDWPNGEWDSPSDFLANEQRHAQAQAMASLDASPEDAARSQELSQATGTPAALIYPDVQGFEAQHKAKLTSDLLRNNDYLAQFANSDPIVPKVATNDWGNLDSLSEHLQQLSKLNPILNAMSALGQATKGVGESFGKDFTSGFDDVSDDEFKNHPLRASIQAGLNTAVGVGATTLGLPLEFPTRFLAATSKNITGSDEVANQVSEKLSDLGDATMMAAISLGLPVGEVVGELGSAALSKMSMWLKDGKLPPAGITPEMDAYKLKANQDALKPLDDSIKEAQTVSFKDQAPDLLSKFVEQHVQDARLGVSGTRALELYGDKVPEPDDGILGWLPDIHEQLQVARDTGADISIPIKDYVANIDPDVHKELTDFLRPVEGGITNQEAKDALPPVPSIDEAVSVLRNNAGLEPMFSIGDRKLQLTKLASKSDQFGESQGFHDFDMQNENGQSVGTLNLSEQKGGKELYVDNINGLGDYYHPNNFGPGLMRDLLRQIKAAFPNAETLTGHRVSGARGEAGTYDQPLALPKIRLDDNGPQGWQFSDANERFSELLGGGWQKMNSTLQAYIKPSELWKEHENEIYDAVQDELGRIVPKVQSSAVSEIERTDPRRPGNISGAYFRQDPGVVSDPFIVWAMNAPDSLGTARHEAMHALRHGGFFTDNEWGILEKAAKDEGWAEKYNIADRYRFESPDIRSEESIAEGFRHWSEEFEQRQRQPNMQLSPIDHIFQKVKDLLDRIRQHIRSITGTENFNDLFEKTLSGEVGAREGEGSDITGAPLAQEPDRPISEPGQGIDVSSPFRAPRDVGMALDQHKRYMKLIEARQQADIRTVEKRVHAEQEKRQSAEWKAQGEAMRPKVVADLNARPDIAADKFFGLGELLGQKLDKTYKLDWDSLTPEQRKALPESYTVRKGGVKPDEVASLFGYPTGDHMIDGLAKITGVRDAMNVRRDRFMRKLTDDEIQRRMEIEHGFLEKNILEDTKDQVLSETQMQLLHQERMHLAQMAGENSEEGLTLDGLTSALKEKFDQLPVGSVTSDKYLREAGKQGKMAELSLLQEKPKEAFLAKQVQQHNAIYADFARRLEKARAQLDKAAKPFRKQDIKNIEPEYLNHIQDLLQQAGYRVGRSVENIVENTNRRGKTLEEFANEKLSESNGYRDIPIADNIIEGKVREVDGMTTHDFMGFKSTIDALIKNGRDEQRVITDGKSFDRKEIVDEMIQHVKTFDLQPLKASAGKFDKAFKFPGTMLAAVTNIETFLNRLGRRDPQSVFNKHITYPAFAAAGEKFRIGNEIAKELKDIGDFADGNKQVAPPFLAPDGRQFQNFTNRNVWGMLQHAGNKSNWEKFAKGWGQDPQRLMTWLENNSTKEHWQWMQSFGDRVFGNISKKTDQVYESINGTTIDKIPLLKFANKHGTFDGWYSPLLPDLDYTGKSPLKFGGYDDTDFGHISPSNGYTQKRTGALYPISMDPSRTMTKINQMIHDAAYREFVLNAQKLLRDPRLNDAITAHYGEEYNGKNYLVPWLEDLAGQESTPAKALSEAGRVAEGLRQNIISTYIGYNPGTVLKHGPTAWAYSMKQVGPANFLRAMKDLYLRGDDINAKNNEYILGLSNELPMRERFWEDTIAGQYSRLEQAHGFAGFRRQVQEYGALAVAKSDMISAKPTFLAAFRDARENMDMSIGDARDYADSQVRQAHGSIAAPNLPQAVRGGGAMGRFYTSLYGFFGTTMQRRIEGVQDINDAYKFVKQGEFNSAMKKSGSAFTNFMTYWVIPTAIEEGVTGLTTDDRRGWGSHLLAATFLGLSSTVLFVRDIVHGIESGHATGTGLLDSALGEFTHGIQAPFKHDAWSKARAGKTVSDTLTAFGLATGVAPKTIDNATRFGIDLVNGQAHPKSVGDWYRGLVRGTPQERVEK